MGTEIGTKDADLAESLLGTQLVEDACSFGFFQAVALLQRLRESMRPVGGFSSPEDEAVHFRVNPRLGFPASEIQKLEMHGDAPAEMTVNFMGLTGPMGVLPYAYSELILERAPATATRRCASSSTSSIIARFRCFTGLGNGRISL